MNGRRAQHECMNEWTWKKKSKELRGEKIKTGTSKHIFAAFCIHNTHVHSNSRTVRRNETDNRAMTVVRSFPFSFLQFRFLCLPVSSFFLCHTPIFHSICARLCRPHTHSLFLSFSRTKDILFKFNFSNNFCRPLIAMRFFHALSKSASDCK